MSYGTNICGVFFIQKKKTKLIVKITSIVNDNGLLFMLQFVLKAENLVHRPRRGTNTFFFWNPLTLTNC